MKNPILTFIILLTCWLSGYAQSECDMLFEINKADCNRQDEKVISVSRQFLNAYPSSSLAEEVQLLIARKYFELEKLDSARETLNILLKINQYNNAIDLNHVKCEHPIITFEGQYCGHTTYTMTEQAIKREANSLLARISSKQNNYRQALAEFDDAQKNHPYQSWCGNGIASNAIYVAMIYADLYKKLDETDSAINYLSPLIIDNGLANNNGLVDNLTSLLLQTQNAQTLKDSIDNSINNLQVKREIVWSNWVEEEDEETGEILQSTVTKTYGRVVYWNYLGQRYQILKTDDYASRLTYPNSSNRKKRHLKPYETDEELKAKAKRIIKTYRIYKNIENANS